VFLDPTVMPVDWGWRLGFAIGGVLGLCILLLRGFVPESPRWLVTHGWKGQSSPAMGGKNATRTTARNRKPAQTRARRASSARTA